VSSTSSSWWSRLFSGGAPADAAQRLERMEQQLTELGRQVAALRSAIAPEVGGDGADIAALHEALLGLEKQVGRAGREQLKINTVAEAQSVQLAEALEQLRAADSRRAAEIDSLREQQRREQTAARRAMAQEFLPALDGLFGADGPIRISTEELASLAVKHAHHYFTSQIIAKENQDFGKHPRELFWPVAGGVEIHSVFIHPLFTSASGLAKYQRRHFANIDYGMIPRMFADSGSIKIIDDPRKAYVIESPDSLWPPDPNSVLIDPGAPPGPSGETPGPSCS